MTNIAKQTDNSETDAAAVQDRQQFVTFSLNGQYYCIDIMSVREIRMAQKIAPVPGAADYVLGVINLRGSIIPVCDLRYRLGEGETNVCPKHPVVIVWVDGRLTGILVDEVLDIINVPRGDVQTIPDTEKNKRYPFFDVLIMKDETMLIVVDLECLFDANPMSKEIERV